MTEQERLEAQLATLDDQLSKFIDMVNTSFQGMVEAVTDKDVGRVQGASDAVQMASVVTNQLNDARNQVQRRLEFLATEELARTSVKVAESSARAAWAAFWVAMIALAVAVIAIFA